MANGSPLDNITTVTVALGILKGTFDYGYGKLMDSANDWWKEKQEDYRKNYQLVVMPTEDSENNIGYEPAIVRKPGNPGDSRRSEDPISDEQLRKLNKDRDTDELIAKLVGNNFGSGSTATSQLQTQIASRLEFLIDILQQQQQAQKQELYINTSNVLTEGIGQESMTTRGSNELSLSNSLAIIQKNIDELAKYGYDVTQLLTDKAKYEDLQKAKYAKQEERAKVDFQNDTALTSARTSGDKTALANAQFDIDVEQLKRQRDDGVAKDSGSAQVADDWYNKKFKEAEQKKLEAIRAGKIEEYDLELRHNERLKVLEGKTQEEIDRLNRQTLEKKLSYIKKELQDPTLAPDKREALEKYQVNTIQQQKEIDSHDPAGGVKVFRDRLKDRKTNYADIMEESFNRINGSAEQHFNKMLTGAESFSQGFKGIFKDMTSEISKMLLKIFYKQVIEKKLGGWFGDLLGKIFKAEGGPVSSQTSYIVGERGPELFVPDHAGTIIPNHRLDETLAMAKQQVTSGANYTPSVTRGQAPPVIVNVVNKSGVKANTKQETSWDGQQYVINVVMDAYARNVNGMRDVLGVRR